MEFFVNYEMNPTHRPGGQYGNDNAAKDHVDSEKDYSVATTMWHSMLKDNMRSWNAEEFSAVSRYSSGLLSLNHYLRLGKNDRYYEYSKHYYKSIIKNLLSAMRPLPHSAVLYRGVHSFPDMEIGKVFKDRGFVSASVLKDIAYSFGGDLVAIRVPKGTPVITGNYSGGMVEGNEKEFILPPWSHFKITSVAQTDKGRRIDMDYIPTRSGK